MDYSTFAKLEDLKIMSRGNPNKIAEYTTKAKQFEELKEKHFNDDFPFAERFDELHLNKLKKYAEDNPDDESAQVRYAIQKERFAAQEKQKTAHIDLRIKRNELMQKLRNNSELTKTDLLHAEQLAKKNPSYENLSLYSRIKKKLDN